MKRMSVGILFFTQLFHNQAVPNSSPFGPHDEIQDPLNKLSLYNFNCNEMENK